MNILYIVGEFPKLSQTFILNQITGLIDAGHHVTVLAKKSESNHKIHEDVSKYHLLDHVIYYDENGRDSKFFKGLTFIKSIFSFGYSQLLHKNHPIHLSWKVLLSSPNLILLYNRLKKEPLLDIDVVHAHFGPNGLLAHRLIQMGLIRGQLFTTFHGYDMLRFIKQKGDDVYTDLFQSKTVLLPISNFWKRKLEGMGANPARTIVHHMGIDVDKFEYHPIKMSQDIKIMSIARFVEKKGLIYGIQAVSKLIKKGYNITYSMIGGGPLEKEFRSMISNEGLEDHIRLLGWKTQEQVIEIMKESHVVLLPSVTSHDGDMEGIPVILMEAMAMGKIVVSTYHSGIPELIEHGVNGFLVEERNVDELVHTLADIFSLEDSISISKQARETVLNQYNIDKLNRRLIDTFERKTH
ncbi:glycosyltransferase [Terrilactibacillus laevilacticus]|uniref:Glycosyltransferase n=1 Tax=Terrilactibacillus laevilacticus TaxID=1380157 RepID=A0ABW5PMY4_9BACI|nr:glycosyltransferase [Terrilactibacillus laevilacticus]